MLEEAWTSLVTAGKDSVAINVRFARRERLSISVYPDGSVVAVAPLGKSLSEVNAYVQNRRRWILKQRQYFAKYQPFPLEKRYVPGETHQFLGRQYRLKIAMSDEPSVKLVGAFFRVEVPKLGNPKEIELLLGQWYRSHAESLFADRIKICCRKAEPLRRLGIVRHQVRTMERRWGSCSRAGLITLNLNLIKTPLHCVDYVITHELCHLIIHSHDPRFYQLLGRCMPDWSARRERLNSIVIR